MVLVVKTQPVLVGDHEYMMRRLWDLTQHPSRAAADQVLPAGGEWLNTTGDDGTSSFSSALWPLFGVIWPAGHALARVVDSMALRGARMLEVGCGLGLAGVVAHRQGVDVTMSDHHPLVPVFLEHNVAINGLAPLPYRHHDFERPGGDAERYDIIIGSDVLYERGHGDALPRFLDQHLRPRAMVLVVDPGRRGTGRFGRHMESQGMALRRTDCALPDDPQDRTGRVLAFTRGGGWADVPTATARSSDVDTRP